MPEQDRTFWPIYLAKKIEGNAFKEDIYFTNYCLGISFPYFIKNLVNKHIYLWKLESAHLYLQKGSNPNSETQKSSKIEIVKWLFVGYNSNCSIQNLQ